MRTNIPKTKDLNAVAERELPFTGNAAYLPYEEGTFTSKYDKQADELRQHILNLPDTPPETERVYYISYKGDNKNDGRSPETPWKDFYRIGETIPNSTVLFERGGVYRGRFVAKSNMFYGAYGEGPKPQLLGSKINYSVPEMWVDEGDNIWSITYEKSQDVGNIIFDHGVVSAMRCFLKSELDSDYKYYYDREEKKTYLYFSKGNPALYHAEIDITDLGHAPNIIDIPTGRSSITIENLCLKYGNFAIHVSGYSEGITMRGCEMGFIGGCAVSDLSVRWGNGVEIWGSAYNAVIENCWVYQCYDAGITNQCSANPECPNCFDGVRFSDNLLEFSQYNIEFFNSETEGSYCKDISYTDNIIRFAGYQVFDPKKRLGSNSSATAGICMWARDPYVENFVISGNIIDTSYGYMINSAYHNAPTDPDIYGNSYLQQPQMPTYYWGNDGYPMKTAVMPKHIVDSYESMVEGVKALDTNPKDIEYIK